MAEDPSQPFNRLESVCHEETPLRQVRPAQKICITSVCQPVASGGHGSIITPSKLGDNSSTLPYANEGFLDFLVASLGLRDTGFPTPQTLQISLCRGGLLGECVQLSGPLLSICLIGISFRQRSTKWKHTCN